MKDKFTYNRILKSILTFFLPSLAFAQLDLSGAGSNFRSVIINAIRVIDSIIPILFLGAFTFFFWGVSKTILRSSSPGDLEKGRSYVIWAIGALFVLVAFRGIIFFFMSDFQLGTSAPSVPGILLESRP